jgi:hypothetical protein
MINEIDYLEQNYENISFHCYGLDDRVAIPGRGSYGFFLFAADSRPDLGPYQPPIQWVPGAFIPVVKRSVCEADH